MTSAEQPNWEWENNGQWGGGNEKEALSPPATCPLLSSWAIGDGSQSQAQAWQSFFKAPSFRKPPLNCQGNASQPSPFPVCQAGCLRQELMVLSSLRASRVLKLPPHHLPTPQVLSFSFLCLPSSLLSFLFLGSPSSLCSPSFSLFIVLPALVRLKKTSC